MFTIDFAPQSSAEWLSWHTTPNASDPTVVSTRYVEEYGVTFRGLSQSYLNGARLLRVPAGGVPWTAHSGNAMVGWSSDQTGGPSGNATLPQFIEFAATQTEVSFWLMSGTGFSTLPGTGGGPSAPLGSSAILQLTAYSGLTQVLATTPIVLAGDGQWHQFSVAAAGITRIALTAEQGNVPYVIWMDDLTFTNIPGPSGAGLVAAGLVLAAGSRRR